MGLLEERYRSVLRLLPASYRQVWEEDMVAAYLEGVADDPDVAADLVEFGRPSLAEVWSVAVLAVRLRLGDVDGPPLASAWGQAVRLAVLAGVLARAVLVLGAVGTAMWAAGVFGPSSSAPVEWAPGVLGPVGAALFLVPAVWGLVLLALALGHRRAAQLLALLVVVPAVVRGGAILLGGDLVGSVAIGVTVLGDLVLTLAMAAFPEGRPPAHRGRWLLALPVGTGVLAVPLLVFEAVASRAPDPQGTFLLLDPSGLDCLLVVLAALGYRVVQAFRPSAEPLPASLALTLLAAYVAAARLLTLPGYLRDVHLGAVLAVAAVELALLLVAVGPLAVAAVRGLRRLRPPAAEPRRTGA